jgi:hypothetical protein
MRSSPRLLRMVGCWRPSTVSSCMNFGFARGARSR